MAQTCGFEGCTRALSTYGLCKAHRRQQLDGLELSPIPSRKPREPKGPCEFDGCDRTQWARGLCQQHHRQWKRTGECWTIGDRNRASESQRKLWAGLTDEEKAERLKPIFGPGHYTRSEEWSRKVSERNRRVWAEGRGGPKGTRFCNACGEEFKPNSGPQIYCGYRCKKLRERAANYGIELPELMALIRQHGGKCAICQSDARLHIDHDHETGVVRGLLCQNCNTGLGKFGDDPETLRRALEYLTT